MIVRGSAPVRERYLRIVSRDAPSSRNPRIFRSVPALRPQSSATREHLGERAVRLCVTIIQV